MGSGGSKKSKTQEVITIKLAPTGAPQPKPEP